MWTLLDNKNQLGKEAALWCWGSRNQPYMIAWQGYHQDSTDQQCM